MNCIDMLMERFMKLKTNRTLIENTNYAERIYNSIDENMGTLLNEIKITNARILKEYDRIFMCI